MNFYYLKKRRKEAEIENRKNGYLEEDATIELEDVIPYTKRGKVVIETMEQAIQAAINLSKHLS